MSARHTFGAGVLALCVLAPAAPADPPNGDKPAVPSRRGGGDGEEIKLAALDEAFKQRVAAAVAKGQAFLLTRPEKDGRWTTKHDNHGKHAPFRNGGTALAVLTLIKCGVNPARKEIADGITFLKGSWDDFKAGGGKAGKPWKTYEAGITLMALEALDRWRPMNWKKGKSQPAGKQLKKQGFDQWAKQLRDFLVANQVVTREVMPGADKKGGSSSGPIRRKESWSYPSSANMESDHSNTQYAVLGLRSAANLGFPPPPEVWMGVLLHFLDMQETTGPKVKRKVLDVKQVREKGGTTRTRRRIKTEAHVTDTARGWGYPGGNMPNPAGGQLGTTGSMTTVGLACVAIAWHELNVMGRGDAKRRLRPDPKLRKQLIVSDLGRRVQTSLMDGFAWLGNKWSVRENPQLGHWHYYYLYGLERAGILTGTDAIGGHDWYREGGDLLLDAQAGNGSWNSGNDDGLIPSTCFALLFLKRATVPLVVTTK